MRSTTTASHTLSRSELTPYPEIPGSTRHSEFKKRGLFPSFQVRSIYSVDVNDKQREFAPSGRVSVADLFWNVKFQPTRRQRELSLAESSPPILEVHVNNRIE